MVCCIPRSGAGDNADGDVCDDFGGHRNDNEAGDSIVTSDGTVIEG